MSDSPTATAAARRLLSRGIPEHSSPDVVAAGVEQIFARLFHTLSEWVGTAGCQALFARAIVLSAPNRPVLTGVLYRPQAVPQAVPHLDRLADNAREFGSQATAEGAATVLAAIITILVGLIGEDIAMTLLEEAQRDH